MYGYRSYGGGYKRRRSSGSSWAATKLRQLQSRLRREAKKFPRSKYGRAYIPRGSEWSLSQFGADLASATEAQKANRKAAGFTGKGGYWGRVFGRTLGSLVGMGDAGAALGDKAGDAIEGQVRKFIPFLGHGEYVENSLVNPQPGDPNVPRMASSMDETGALTIVHREYVMDVQGTSQFQNNGFLVNPTNTTLFPFLSQFACNFDEYEFEQLLFKYRPVTSSLASSNAQLGTVILVADYNAGTAEVFATKAAMMQYDGAVSARICDPIVFGVECDSSKKVTGTLFVPPAGNTPAGEDPKTYNLALVQVATNQCVAQGQIGELWVEYKVRLRKPKFCVAQGSNLPYLAMSFAGSTVDSPVGLGLSQCVAYSSGTNGNPQMTWNRTNLNNSQVVLFGSSFSSLPSLRSTLNTQFGHLQYWAFGQFSTGGGTIGNAYLVLPDTLGFGSYQLQLTVKTPIVVVSSMTASACVS